MSRKHFVMSTLSLAVALSLAGPDALALGIGGLRVQSALNQPFVGEIDLLDVKPDELDSVKAQIAGVAEFSKAGAERYHYLSKLHFTPQISPRGRTVLRVSSREPIREPYMDFLVEVQWPKGRVVKEYTVLLDPAVTTGRAPSRIEQPIAQARSVPAESESRPRPVERLADRSRKVAAPPAADSTPQAIPVGVPTDGFPKYVGPVRTGTGLWRLAAHNAPQGATVAQTAMALYRNNQGAFSRGNINRLAAGKTLVIPSAAELFALDPEAAQQELAAAMRGQTVRRTPIAPATGAPDSQSRLRIAGTASPGDKTGTVAPAAGPEGMEQELLLVREAGESTRQETQEMRGRIRELETQLTEIQKLLQLRNAELARIQNGVPGQPDVAAVDSVTPPGPGGAGQTGVDGAVQGPPEGQTVAGGEGSTPSSGPLPGTSPPGASAPGGEGTQAGTPPVGPAAAGADASGLAPAGSGAPTGTEPLPVAPAPTADVNATNVPPQGPVTAQAPSSAGQTRIEVPPTATPTSARPPRMEASPPDEAAGDSTWHALLMPLAGIAGAAALGIGALTWWRSRGRRREEDDGADLDSDELTEAFAPATSSPRASSGVPQNARGSSGAESEEAGSVAPLSSAMASFRRGEPETDETDVISEADIYIAYGRFREAEDLLRDEIRRAPNRLDLKLKLAEAFLGAKNRPAIEALIKEMQSSGAGGARAEQLQRLSEMAASIQPEEEASSEFRPEGRSASAGGVGPVPTAQGLSADSHDVVSHEVFSLDISDVKRPVSQRPGLSRGRDSGLFSSEPKPFGLGLEFGDLTPAAAEGRPVAPALDDVGPLIMDDEEFTGHLGVEDDSEDLNQGLAPLPASGTAGSSFDQHSKDSSRASQGGISELDLNIDELWAASDVDLESFVDATQTGLQDPEPKLGYFDEPPLGRSQPTPLRSVATETARGQQPSAMTGLFGGQEESASSDLLTSQWQMDSGLWDETATKLDLARAYIEMGDNESAKGILEEVAGEGTEDQRAEASELLRRVD